MTTALSPTGCYFCHSDENIQAFGFPCDCMIYAHPDCYKTYIYNSSHTQGICCVKCKEYSQMKRGQLIQIVIPHENHDDTNQLTQLFVNKRGYIVILCTIISNLLISGAITFVAWSSIQFVFGVII
jgi:hypothetical protein